MLAPSVTTEKRNINDLSREEKKVLMREQWNITSEFQKKFGFDKIELDCENYYKEFRDIITSTLIRKGIIDRYLSLENLHEYLSDEMRAYDFESGVNKVSTYMYEMDGDFMNAYHKFVKEFLQDEVFKEPLWFQQTPTIRIHCPDAVNSHHYPRYHTDINYGHPPQEVNIWMPITEVKEGHSFRLSDIKRSKDILEKFDFDFEPFVEKAINDKNFNKELDSYSEDVRTEPGKVLLFDSRSVHTGEPMKSHTRVSIDIRVIPVDEFEEMGIIYQGKGRRKILFTPGHCYNSLSSDQI